MPPVARRRLARHAVGLVGARRQAPVHDPPANAAIAIQLIHVLLPLGLQAVRLATPRWSRYPIAFTTSSVDMTAWARKLKLMSAAW